MKISECIAARRSVFPDQYIDKEISREILEQLLEAANCAPSHKKTMPWRFKVLQDNALKQLGKFLAQCYIEHTPEYKISEFKINKLKNSPTKAGAIIAICMQRDVKERVPEWEEIAATAMAVQNMWLLATELGLGSYWSSPSFIKEMGNFFNLAQGERCLGFFYLGHYDASNVPERNRDDFLQKVTWI